MKGMLIMPIPAEVLNNGVNAEMECIIRNMRLQDKYLMPLRNFRDGTDFQVPIETASFLDAKNQGIYLV